MSGLIIVSGGLDSTTLAHYLVKNRPGEYTALSYLYGQQHSQEVELAKLQAKALSIEHHVVDVTSIYRPLQSSSALLGGAEIPTIDEVVGDPQPITYVPFRNTLMLTIAAAYAETFGHDAVYYGAQKHDEYSGYWDTTGSFIESLQSVFDQNRAHKIMIRAPFVNLSKSDIAIIAKELGVDVGKTLSCYSGTNCGTCPTCADRIQAFINAGIKDPLYPNIDFKVKDTVDAEASLAKVI